ncbi:hypothetical protein ANANG_G00272060 [Anguilla anguilla]|uniref:Secreted protein n=1 Tax=Anguilla anguilla TaxID=7936 RepID=A0A9D3LQ32_ANGAN|nr:hypothetical protein ANANG_G00272060 [Anguilla anguilla]
MLKSLFIAIVHYLLSSLFGRTASLAESKLATAGGEVPRGPLASGALRIRRLWISHLSDHTEHQDGDVSPTPHGTLPSCHHQGAGRLSSRTQGLDAPPTRT